jgi:hypothetical protein
MPQPKSFSPNTWAVATKRHSEESAFTLYYALPARKLSCWRRVLFMYPSNLCAPACLFVNAQHQRRSARGGFIRDAGKLFKELFQLVNRRCAFDPLLRLLKQGRKPSFHQYEDRHTQRLASPLASPRASLSARIFLILGSFSIRSSYMLSLSSIIRLSSKTSIHSIQMFQSEQLSETCTIICGRIQWKQLH